MTVTAPVADIRVLVAGGALIAFTTMVDDPVSVKAPETAKPEELPTPMAAFDARLTSRL